MFRKPESQGYVLPDARIMTTPEKGNGVYANRKYGKHELIERAPTLKFHMESLKTIQDITGGRFILSDYVFTRGNACHCALGWVAVYNHSDIPNAWWTIPSDHSCIEVRALRDIEPGEEITHAYVRSPDGKSLVWFEASEGSSEPVEPVLGSGISEEWAGDSVEGKGVRG
jgi:hypothetical protein